MSEPRFAATLDARIAYHERGPRDGPPVLLVHGFPDDARTWDALVPALVAAGYRTIAPYLRGFGPTALTDDAPRNGEIGALAFDVLALPTRSGSRASTTSATTGARAPATPSPRSRRSACARCVRWPSPTARTLPRSDSRSSRPGRTGTSGTSRRHAARPSCRRTGTRSAARCGATGRRAGTSTRPSTTRPPPRSGTPISSRSRSRRTASAGGSCRAPSATPPSAPRSRRRHA